MTSRFARVCLTLEPLNELAVPCDQFEVDEDGNVAVYYNGELCGFFTSPEYVYIVDSEFDKEDESVSQETSNNDELEDESDDEDDEEDDEEDVSVVIPDDLSDLEALSEEDRDSR